MHDDLIANRFSLLELPGRDTQKTLEQDVLDGLFDTPRSLPPKYFYDDVGSELFDAICSTKDYYLTRTEYALLKQHTDRIIADTNPNVSIELGAGTSEKTELLLSSISKRSVSHTFISIDVCKGMLEQSAKRILLRYPNLKVHSIVGEYAQAIQAIPEIKHPALYLFIGSSIGNFTQQEAVDLLSKLAQKMQREDFLLFGVDRVKEKVVLEKAYDDSEGVTAKFNLNVLKVMNAKLGSNFALEKFSHLASYNERKEQIEMYLVSEEEQKIDFKNLGRILHLQKGEKILTEISRKYTRSSLQYLLTQSGLIEHTHFEATKNQYSLVLARLAQG